MPLVVNGCVIVHPHRLIQGNLFPSEQAYVVLDHAMNESEPNSVSAFFSGIRSGLGRMVIAWIVVSLSLAIPFLPYFGAETLKSLLFWPLGVLYGIVAWARFPFPWSLGALLFPAGMILGTWGYLTDHRPLRSLWILANMSIVLTAPALWDHDVQRGVFWFILTLWIVLDCWIGSRILRWETE